MSDTRLRAWRVQKPVGFFVASMVGLAPVSAFAASTSVSVSPPSRTAPVASVSFRPAIGQERSYLLTSKGTASIDMQAIAATLSPGGKNTQTQKLSHTFDVSARLGMRVLGREGGSWLVAMRLDAPAFKVDGTLDARVSALTTPFLGRFSERGELTALEFPVQYPQEAAMAIRGLVEPLQVVFSPSSGETWTTDERGMSGTSTVDYALDGIDANAGVARIKRTVKKANRDLFGSGPQDRARFRTEVEASSGSIAWALDGSGPVSMTISEKTRSLSQTRKPVAASDTVFSATRTNERVSGLPTSIAELRDALADVQYARASFYKVPAQFEEEIRGIDFVKAKTLYAQNIGTQTPDAVQMARFWLRLNPTRTLDFARFLDEASRAEQSDARDNLVGYGFAAMAAAGHTEAQKTLVQILGEEATWSALSRRKALDALLSLEMPERFVPAAVWTFRQKLPQSGPNVSLEGLSIATNIYGQMGNVELGVKENTDEVIRNLSTILQSGDNFEKRRALVAFGNIGDPALVLPITERYLTHPDELVRQRAFDGFKGTHDEATFRKFAAAFARERTMDVKRDATELALMMADMPARNEWAASLVRSSDDQVIQMRGVLILGRGIKAYPENEQTLQALLDDVRDREVRRTIYTFVAPKPRGAK